MSVENTTPVKRPPYFLVTTLLVGAMSAVAVVSPELLTETVTRFGNFFYLKFDWLIMWLPLLAFAVGLAAALPTRFGSIRLGGKDARPEYSMFSWISMLFTAGIGVGLVFFGPIEALWHYFHSPIGAKAALPEYQKVENAMSLALHVWGIPAWSLYMVAGLVMAYFTYQHQTECTPAAPLQYGFRHKKWAKPLGVLVTGMAVLSIAMSVSSSIAMAAGQIASGLKIITGIESFSGTLWKTAVLAAVAVCYTAGAVLPISKGMKWLGDLTVFLSVALLLFVFLTGPTHYFLSTITNSIGNILTQTVHHSFELYLFHNRDWMVWYPMAYWVWWITWAPFVGVFLAKISKGRTLREFVFASVFLPTGFIVIWFSVFSGFSLLDTVEGSGRLAQIANTGDYEGAFYHLLNMFPLAEATKPLTIVLFLGFVVTTVTSAGISLGIMTSNDGRSENKFRAVVWCVFMTLISYAVVVTGKIEGIKAVGSFSGFPFVFVMYLWFAAFWRQLNRDTRNPKPQE